MDRIEINGLRVMTLVGVLTHEREFAQPLEFDIVLEGELIDGGSVLRGELENPGIEPVTGRVTIVPVQDEVSL